ncbi:MetQ/NlpA family ABC transporter substrate-binding protein [Hathewaya massiliensis]|uniref:MetQ/NlpA family ABC transporter substrate-binding protein n=1 Tax=Hathewaya massiliensis TaxID=1964382 RepID=UPI001158E6A8|nr:MetQ/NlpA family ABC transporter substrate-binding protein [Hathewaya massiliensis]
MLKKLRKFVVMSMVVTLAMSAIGCGNNKVDKKDDASRKNIKIGVMAITEPIAKLLKDALKEKEYNIEIVTYDGNQLPATALKDNSIDGVILNHNPWIQKFNKENNCKLVMVEPYLYYGQTNLYSSKYRSVKDIPNNAKITIQGDPANMDRNLTFLERLGLLKLGKKTGEFYSVMDIKDNPKNLNLIEAEITAVTRSYKDVDAMISGASIAKKGGVPKEDIIIEDETSKEYPLGLIVRDGDQNSEWVKACNEVFQTQDFKDKFNKEYDGSYTLFKEK